MGRRVVVVDAAVVRATIARGMLLNGTPCAPTLGEVTLEPHQLDAVTRIQNAVAEFNGALLADSVGLGKTFVALAVARAHDDVTVIAPAVLRSTWHDAAIRAATPVTFITTESFGRKAPAISAPRFVIVDEAHHFRNDNTARYERLARFTARAPIILLSATPLHNRERDLHALLALFLGSAAATLDRAALARCIVRREHADLPRFTLPRIGRTKRIEILANPEILDALLAIPPPVPPRESGTAPTLVRLALARIWASSDGALVAALRRRLSTGEAMRVAMAAGRMPTKRELRSWLAADDIVQLGFAELLFERDDQVTSHMRTLDDHLAATRALLGLVRANPGRDAARAYALRTLRERHSRCRVIAFSAFAETVKTLYRLLERDGGVAALTGGGGRVATGRVSQDEIVRMFKHPNGAREEIDLLLASDLLSEGVNLPEAGVVVHLDVPWTAARLEQRVGRARRPGGTLRNITTYAFVQPPSVEQRLRAEAIVHRKALLGARVIGAASYDAVPLEGNSPARATERIRAILRSWTSSAQLPEEGRIRIATVRAEVRGFVAAVRLDHEIRLIGSIDGAPATIDAVAISEVLPAADGEQIATRTCDYAAARRAIQRCVSDLAITDMVDGGGVPATRRPYLVRLDRLMSRIPTHARSHYARRIARARRTLASRLSRGLELEVEQIHQRCESDADFLAGLERGLGEVVQHRTPAPPTAIVAVLLLRRTALGGDIATHILNRGGLGAGPSEGRIGSGGYAATFYGSLQVNFAVSRRRQHDPRLNAYV